MEMGSLAGERVGGMSPWRGLRAAPGVSRRGVMGSAWLSPHRPKKLEWTIRAEKASSVSEFAFNSTGK